MIDVIGVRKLEEKDCKDRFYGGILGRALAEECNKYAVGYKKGSNNIALRSEEFQKEVQEQMLDLLARLTVINRHWHFDQEETK